jgi:hypothetical protein
MILKIVSKIRQGIVRVKIFAKFVHIKLIK